MRKIKRLSLFVIMFAMVIFLLACQEEKTFEITFDFDNGSPVHTRTVKEGDLVTKPTDPEKEGFNFEYWMLDDLEYQFSTPVSKDITLVALWFDEVGGKIQEDILAAKDELLVSSFLLNFPRRGSIHRSDITWTIVSDEIMPSGIIVPPKKGEPDITVQVKGNFSLEGKTREETFSFTVSAKESTVLSVVEETDFTNLTTEYTVADNKVDLYFEENGSIPYIKVREFFELLTGFVDPDIEFTFTTEEGKLTIFYQYYDADEDHTYDLICTIDTVSNTITTNDPGFYWAYVYSTETNYGRHIFYDRDHLDKSELEGQDVVYDLNLYNLESLVHEEEVLLPYFLVNQLFAGSSYYNVYYNTDGLYGIYALPESGSSEYRTIKKSSLNDTDIPADLVLHNYHMLAFNLDYFYGLKDYFDVDTYYDLLETNKKALLTTDAQKLDETIFKILLKDIDEPHTSYGYPSYFNKRNYAGPPLTSLQVYGSRFQKWYYDGFIAVDEAIEDKWGREGLSPNQWAAGSLNRPNYWFLDDEHAVLILDSFVTSDIEESKTYSKEIIEKQTEIEDVSQIIPNIHEGDKFFYYKNSTRTNMLVETLVKGVDVLYVDTYKQALINLGYVFHLESTDSELKEKGYFSKTVEDVSYMIQIGYDEDYELFYVGIMDKVPETYEGGWPFYRNIEDLVESDSAVFMEMTLEKMLKEKPTISSVTLDITWNTGGNVGALYRVVGFITDEPFRVTSMDGSSKSAGSSYVYIDGIESYAHLNWSLLTSPLTFSAANQLATIFKENNLGPIIGQRSGGGASSITPVLLPNGTAFTMSSNNISALRLGIDDYTYEPNELGIEPDFVIDMSEIYDVATLLDILK